MAPTLKLFILQGNNFVNDITGQVSPISSPIVEVRDLNDQPVEAADVIFELPSSGAGGSFPGNKITYTGHTNVQGQARAPFLPNALPGRFEIKVTATSAGRFGRISIPQTNASGFSSGGGDRPRSRLTSKKLLIIGAVAAGAIGVGVYFAVRGSSPVSTGVTPTAPTIVITPGTPVFGR